MWSKFAHFLPQVKIFYYLYHCVKRINSKRIMTTLTLSTNNVQFVHLFENLAKALNVPFEKVKKSASLTKSMQKALDEEKSGQLTKLISHKNAVAEILG
jgi:hypothetical protein